MATTTIGAFRHSCADRVGLVKKLAAFEVWNRVTQKNPVDTGRSRAAWNLAINAPDLSVPPEPAKGSLTPTPTLPAIGEVRPGDVVIVSNNLPYIGPLERGHSQQAPNGFVRASLDEVVGVMAGIVANVKRLGEQHA